MRSLPLILALSACAPPETEVEVDPNAPAALVQPSNGDCPSITGTGVVDLKSNGRDRQVRIYVPDGDDGEDAPVVFFWHPLGATARLMAQYFDFQILADAHEMIFVLPEATRDAPYEWAFWLDDGGDDAVFYDDLRTCLVRELGADVRRVHTAGMSAGGLWSTWLTVHRADTLASSLVMSGGTGQVVYYETPAQPIPVLVMWGGPSDTYNEGAMQVDFDTQSVQFSEALQADGHLVVECDHGQGHTIPLDGIGTIADWLLPHAYAEPSPFEDGDLSDLPRYCRMPGVDGG